MVPSTPERSSLTATTRQRHHPDCFVCDPHRAAGLRVAYRPVAEGAVAATVDCPAAWEGYPGLVHGGIIASLLDGAMTNCLFSRGLAAVTADLRVRYRHPVELGLPATIRAELTRDAAPLFVLEATLVQGDGVRVTATGKFMLQRLDREG